MSEVQVMRLSQSRFARIALRVLPWAAFVLLLFWAWGVRNPFRTLPAYGDALEPVGAAAWIAEAIAHGQNPLIYPLNFFPEGWHIASHSTGYFLYLALSPVAWVAGAAFAFNLFSVLGCVLAFAGALLLARRFLPAFPATVVALAFAFSGVRWQQPLTGGLHMFLGSAFLPWMLWSVERARSSHRNNAGKASRRRFAWLAAAGLFWALAFVCSLYFVYIGGIMLVIWILTPRNGRENSWRARLIDLCCVGGSFLLLSSPSLILNARESAIADPGYYSIAGAASMGASLNSFPIPFLFHPWLSSIAARLFHGPPFEQELGNFGILGSAAALIGAVLAWRDKAWRATVVLVLVCLVLSLGLVLRWNGDAVQWPALRPLNQWLWQIGHTLKPGFFKDAQPGKSFADAVPLPAYVLTLVLPYLERGRMFARYALAASLGIYLLAGLALARVRRTWLQVIVGCLLILEIVPPPLEVVPFPPENHPAYEWLSQQEPLGDGIVNVFAANPSTLVLAIYGDNLLAPSYHKHPTAAGAAGVLPRHTEYLNNWLATHEHPFWQPDFAALMRSYGVRYVVLEMQSEFEEGLWQEAQVADQVTPIRCFPKPDSVAPWSHKICILEVVPSRWPDLNLLLHDGWSGKEDWGVWAEGTESDAQWIATRKSDARLELSAFPQCVPGQNQKMQLDFNGVPITAHEWVDCEPWTASVKIPAALVQVGANELLLHSAYAAAPENSVASDTRRLSVGFTKLRIDLLESATSGNSAIK
jgi:hypothetical protein